MQTILLKYSWMKKTGKPALEGVEKVVNAFDTYALEMAVRLKEAKGDITVTTLSLGGEDTKNSLKNCLAVGADEAFHIKDESYQEKDAVIIAQALSKGIQKNRRTKRQKNLISFSVEKKLLTLQLDKLELC